MIEVDRDEVIINRGGVNFSKNILPPTIKYGRVHVEMPLFNGTIPFTKKCKKDFDAKEKNETIDNPKQTILIPR